MFGEGFFQVPGETQSWMPRDDIIDSLAILADVEGGTMPLTLESESTEASSPTPYHQELALSTSLAEASGCGPLSRAVLAKDARLAQSLLEKYPVSIEEFPFILEAAGAAGLLQREDGSQQTALFAALAMTEEHCRATTQTSECTQCNCVDSLVMILEAGSIVCDSDLSQLNHHHPRPSLRGWRVFVAQLKVQRENLKELALRNTWAVEEYLDILQSPNVLDLHAYAVYKSLRRHGIDVPMHLVPSDYTNPDQRDAFSKETTVYYHIPLGDESMCELSFQMGFQDVDFDIQYGLPPLCRAYRIHHINWLIQRGADLERRIWPSGDGQLQTNGIFSAHYVLYKVSRKCLNLFNAWDGFPLYGIQELFPITNRALPVSLTDSCRCACSTRGCTPFLFLLKAQCGSQNQSVVADMDLIANIDFSAIFDEFATEITRSLYLAAMRFVGFITLNLTHTCCNAHAIVKRKEPYRPRDLDEVDEIQEEESELIKVLDDMTVEFQTMIANITGDSALSKFQACWKDYWTNRVPEILQELGNNRMTEAERQDAELIGVVWESESDESEVSEDITGNPYDRETIDYWNYELDSIAEDV
ncbi:hypothetical protein PG984_008140 [Apiospora sp. TS-2023a]